MNNMEFGEILEIVCDNVRDGFAVLRDLPAVSEVQDKGPRREDRDSKHVSRRGNPIPTTTSHEPGMVRVSLDLGRVHGIRPNDVVGTIAFHADIPGHTIGKIHIRDKQTFVDVPEKFLEQVLAKAGNFRIRQQPVKVKVA